MKAVVLAAGEGSRLQPITATRPKHLIDIGGKPVLEHCLEALRSSGINEIVIVTHYMSDRIRQYFGNGERVGLRIEYVEQPSMLGTGNAVSVVEQTVDGDFVLVYGDLLFSSDATKSVIDAYDREKPVAAMAVVPVDKPESYGVVEVEYGKNVKRIIEKPSRGEQVSNLANAGIYVFSQEIFEELHRIKTSSRGELELTDALSLLTKEEKAVIAVEISKDDWMDIGSPWDLLAANALVLKRMEHCVLGNVEDGAHLLGPVTVAKSARIRSGAYIEGPSFVGEGSDVGPNCYIRPCTSVGKNVRIGNACEIKNSIIMDYTHVGHLSYVGDSILCERCNLGAGTIIANYRFDAGSVRMRIKDKIVDTERRKLGVILGDDVKTGINALFMPGVKIGVNTWIGPNLTVYKDLAANTVALAKPNGTQFEGKK